MRGKNGKLYPHIKCKKCNQFRHYADNCEEDIDSDELSVNNFQYLINLYQLLKKFTTKELPEVVILDTG